jgi:hypothetical protein
VSVLALAKLTFGQFLVAVLLAAGLSMWVYWHASRHGSRHPTAWGVLTFLFVGFFLPLYFLHYYFVSRRRL